MARNKYPGVCYYCGAPVPSGYGHFERHKDRWLIKCVKCASGRVVTDKDPGVRWAQRSYAEERDGMVVGVAVVCVISGVCGVITKIYTPTASEKQIMVQTGDGRFYHAPYSAWRRQ